MSNQATLRAELAAIEAEWKSKINAAKNMRSIDALHNEGNEGYSLAEATQETLADHYLPRVAALQNAIFAAEWTADVTEARRAAWNAEMMALAAAKQPANTKTIPLIAKRLGYNLTDIRRAMAMHNIK